MSKRVVIELCEACEPLLEVSETVRDIRRFACQACRDRIHYQVAIGKLALMDSPEGRIIPFRREPAGEPRRP